MQKLGLGHLQESEKEKVEAKAGSLIAEVMVTRVCACSAPRPHHMHPMGRETEASEGLAWASGPAQLFVSKAV